MGNSRRDNPRGNALPCFAARPGLDPHTSGGTRMPRLKIFPLFVLCALLCACQMDLRTGGTKADVTPLKSGPAVDRGKKLFVAMPADFTKGQDTEKGSGEDTQQALRKDWRGLRFRRYTHPRPKACNRPWRRPGMRSAPIS